MDWLTLLVLALATWRLSSMIVREAGPFFIFRKIREATGITHEENGAILTVPDNLLAGLISCMWCTSVWMGAIWIVLWVFLPRETIVVASVFTLSAVSIALDRYFQPQNQA